MIKEAVLKLGKHSLIYGLGNIGTKIISILLLPLYTAFLTPADYGVLQICNVLRSIILTIIIMGTSSALFKVYYNDEDEENRKTILGTVVIFYLFIAAIIILPLIFLRDLISPFLIGGERSGYLLLLVLVGAYFEGLITLGLAVLRANEKSVTYAIFSIIRILIFIGLNIVFVATLKRNYIGVKEATLIALIISFIIIFIITYKKINWKFNNVYIKEILVIGIPLAIGGLASWVLNMTDRYMLKFLLPDEIALTQVGLYSLGAKISSFLHFVLVAPFMLSWGALMYSYQNDPNAKNIYKSILNIFTAIGGILFILISLFSPEILNLISQNKDYVVAYKVVPYLTFSKLLFGIYMVFTVGVTLTKNTKYISYANIIAAILNIILNLLFIPKFGMTGAALASLISFIIRTIILYSNAQKHYHINYDIIKVSSFVFVLLGISVIQNYYQIHLILKLVLFLTIVSLTPLTGLVKYSQISSFWKMVMEKVRK
ncbi:MAG: polysaccharide biosynthesis C-terminal domain-containing protein [Candidatus Tenebribacter burtonii]|nr:polysaccharide biosynthesis C-terminal domain-containing protein [Candidatus Tenebribacter burtonii]